MTALRPKLLNLPHATKSVAGRLRAGLAAGILGARLAGGSLLPTRPRCRVPRHSRRPARPRRPSLTAPGLRGGQRDQVRAVVAMLA